MITSIMYCQRYHFYNAHINMLLDNHALWCSSDNPDRLNIHYRQEQVLGTYDIYIVWCSHRIILNKDSKCRLYHHYLQHLEPIFLGQKQNFFPERNPLQGKLPGRRGCLQKAERHLQPL